jgi:methylated-DNA-[protein]-cysteine S-methyltransferase
MSKAVTAFQQRVYDALMLIPAGQATTYAELARYLGIRSPRAVGQALKANPFAPEVPCHRVIRSDLSIGGYSGQVTGAKLAKKINLLKSEGVHFSTENRLKDSSQLFRFS